MAERVHKSNSYKTPPQSRPVLRQDRAMSGKSTTSRLTQYFWFIVAGGLGFVVDASLFLALSATGLGPALARIPSIFAAMFTTWIINRTRTFQTTTAPSLSEFLQYVAAMAVGFLINYSTFLLLFSLSDTIRATPIIALAISTGAAMSVNFLTARFLLNR